MTKSPQQILDQAREEKINQRFKEFEEKFKDISHIGCDNSIPCGTMKRDIFSWHTTTLQSFIEAEIAIEVGEKRIRGKEPYLWNITSDTPLEMGKYDEHHKIIGFNQAKEETISHLKQLKI